MNDAGTTQPRCINVHHHFLPAAYMAAIADKLPPGRGTQRAAQWSPSRDLELMDAAGVDVAIGSISIPGIWFGDIAQSRRLARLWNEAAATIVRDHPGRYGFFATIAPPDKDGSLAEIQHALDGLGADGIALMSSYDGRWLGDADFAPVLAELDRRKALVFVHPAAIPESQSVPGIKSHILEGPFDTTRTIASLLTNGVLARCPNLRFIFAHAGGAMPYLAGRMATLAHGPEEAEAGEALRRLYYDTALSINAPVLAGLLQFCGSSQILLGTDSPILPLGQEMAAWRKLALDPAERRRIEGDNALSLLRRFADARVG